MEFLNKLDLRPKTIFKIFGLVFLGIILLAFAFKLISSSFSPVSRQQFNEIRGIAGVKNMAMPEMAHNASRSFDLSARNIVPDYSQSPTGSSAEDYEVTEYNGSIETRKLKKTCQAISSLKSKDYVIFENANEYNHGCNYYFKVEKDYKDEILTVIKNLDPKDLSENTKTIKRLIDDFTSETEILNKKKTTIENTLNNAINSYDEIAQIATKARDAESLAKIIDSKIRIIERLSQERININEQLDRLMRAKEEQMDRLNYVYFRLNIYENKFVDYELIKDSWKNEIKQFVNDVNKIIQDSSVGIVKIIFYILQFSLYLLVIMIATKYGWKILQKFWRK